MTALRLGLVLAAMLLSSFSSAVNEAYPFENDELRARYQVLIAELRCPKCQNQNLADSNAPIAQDLRHQVHRLLHDGLSDREIEDYLVERYGEFVLYRPRVNQHTVLLWGAPVLMLLVAAVVIASLLRRRRRVPPPAPVQAAELESILKTERDQ